MRKEFGASLVGKYIDPCAVCQPVTGGETYTLKKTAARLRGRIVLVVNHS
jgi:hypothetical protein